MVEADWVSFEDNRGENKVLEEYRLREIVVLQRQLREWIEIRRKRKWSVWLVWRHLGREGHQLTLNWADLFFFYYPLYTVTLLECRSNKERQLHVGLSMSEVEREHLRVNSSAAPFWREVDACLRDVCILNWISQRRATGEIWGREKKQNETCEKRTSEMRAVTEISGGSLSAKLSLYGFDSRRSY